MKTPVEIQIKKDQNKEKFCLGDIEVSSGFIEENKKQQIPIPKKGGPYSDHERQKRRNEVYRLHFEYGYSARKIADMMTVNRNTINCDLDFLYSKAGEGWRTLDRTDWVKIHTERLEIQRSRLREELDRAKTIQERIAIEKLILESDNRMLNIHLKLMESFQTVHTQIVARLNELMKEHQVDQRFITFRDYLMLPDKERDIVLKRNAEGMSKGRSLHEGTRLLKTMF